MKRFWSIVIAFLVISAPIARAQFFKAPEFYNIVTAAQRDNVEDVKKFLAQRMSPNLTDPSGRTALSYAASSNNTEIAQLLLDAGANTDPRDNDGNAPLHFAADGNQLEVLQLLIRFHAMVDIQNKQGVTPLMTASGAGWPRIVRALLAAGADPRKQDFTGRDALGWAAGRPAVQQLIRDAEKR
jgi:uncharacterized protein